MSLPASATGRRHERPSAAARLRAILVFAFLLKAAGDTLDRGVKSIDDHHAALQPIGEHANADGSTSR